MNVLPFQNSVERWRTQCLLCREPCLVESEVRELALGHVIHQKCYTYLLEIEDEGSLRRLFTKLQLPGFQVLAGEEGMSREEVAKRRQQILAGDAEIPKRRSLPLEVVFNRERPSTGSCNDGVSADTGGKDSRPAQVED